jgi:hypothetical protein
MGQLESLGRHDEAARGEVDRANPHLGSPADAVPLASSAVLPRYGVALEDSRELREVCDR